MTSPETPAKTDPAGARKAPPVPMVYALPVERDFFALSQQQQWEGHLDAGRIGERC